MIDATNIQIKIADQGALKKIAFITDGGLSFSTKTRETTRFATGGVETFVPSTTGWQLSGSSFVEYLGFSMFDLIRIAQSRTLISVSFIINDPVQGPIEMSGSGILTTVDGSGSTGQDMKLNYSIQGTGVLSYTFFKTVTLINDAHGSIDLYYNGIKATASQQVKFKINESVVFEAVETDSLVFDYWFLNPGGVLSANPVTVVVTSDIMLQLEFN